MELLLINTVQVARCHVGDTSSRGMAWHDGTDGTARITVLLNMLEQ